MNYFKDEEKQGENKQYSGEKRVQESWMRVNNNLGRRSDDGRSARQAGTLGPRYLC